MQPVRRQMPGFTARPGPAPHNPGPLPAGPGSQGGPSHRQRRPPSLGPWAGGAPQNAPTAAQIARGGDSGSGPPDVPAAASHSGPEGPGRRLLCGKHTSSLHSGLFTPKSRENTPWDGKTDGRERQPRRLCVPSVRPACALRTPRAAGSAPEDERQSRDVCGPGEGAGL